MRSASAAWADEPASSSGRELAAVSPPVLLTLLQAAYFASLAFPPPRPGSSFSLGGDPREDLLRAHGVLNSAETSKTAQAETAPPPPSKAPSEPSSMARTTGGQSPSLQLTAAAEAGTARCPMRNLPFFNQVINAIVEWEPAKLVGYKPKCPAPIVLMRAALARTAPVRALRPKPVLVKFAAVGATSLAVNLPLGVWREHCRKFSPEWFVAVHASIPLIISLRKAVVMPYYAVFVTITAAVAGQFAGSRWERDRLVQEAAARAGQDLAGSRPPKGGGQGRPALPRGPQPLGLFAGGAR